MFKTELFDKGFRVLLDKKCIIEHTENKPAVFLGKGRENISMYRGNFNIRDSLIERIAMPFAGGDSTKLNFNSESMGSFSLELTEKDGLLFISGHSEKANRIWLRLNADENEHIMGGGEQFSCLDLRGKSFPI